MEKLALYVLLSIVFITCSSESASEIKTDQKTLEISLEFDLEKSPLSENVSSYETIPLETNNGNTLVRIDNVLIQDSFLFLHDFQHDLVQIFSLDGRHVTKLGKQGKGPGEYLEMRGISINSNDNEIYTLDYRKIHVYDLLTFEYKRQISMDFDNKGIYNPMSFVSMRKDEFLFWILSPDLYDETEYDTYSLVHYYQGEYKYYYQYIPKEDLYSARFFKRNNKEILIRPPIGDFNVMSWENLKPRITYEFLSDLLKPTDIILKIFSTNKQLYILFIKDTKRYECVFNLDSEQWQVTPRLKTKESPTYIYADSESFYAFLFPYEINEAIEKGTLGNILIPKSLESDKLDDLANPIIYKIKF